MEWAPVMSFEKLLDVQVPRRAEYIRVLTGELNRVMSHIMFVGWMALDLGGLTPILWGFIERDEIVEMLAAHHRPADALQLLPHRRRQRRPQPRVPEPPRTLDEPRDEPARHGAGAPQRERDLRPPDARPGRHRPRDRPADVPDRPEPARDGPAVRHPPGAPVQRLPGPRVRHPDPLRGRLPGPLPAAHGRGPPEPPDHRPVPPRDARRAGPGQAAAAPPAAPRPGLRRGRGPARPARRRTPSATAPTSRSGCASTTRASSTSSRSGC